MGPGFTQGPFFLPIWRRILPFLPHSPYQGAYGVGGRGGSSASTIWAKKHRRWSAARWRAAAVRLWERARFMGLWEPSGRSGICLVWVAVLAGFLGRVLLGGMSPPCYSLLAGGVSAPGPAAGSSATPSEGECLGNSLSEGHAKQVKGWLVWFGDEAGVSA